MNREAINKRLDEIIELKMQMSRDMDGTECPICGFVQGMEYKGIKKSYCEHMTEIIDTKVESQLRSSQNLKKPSRSEDE